MSLSSYTGPGVCPDHSTCHEGTFEAHCECDDGFQEVWVRGKLFCRSELIQELERLLAMLMFLRNAM